MIDAQKSLFSNTRVRRMADFIYSTYLSCQIINGEWTSQSLKNLFPSDDTIVNDGSDQDGRNQITGNDVNNLMVVIQQIVNVLETGTVDRSADNQKQSINTLLKIQVNGSSRIT